MKKFAAEINGGKYINIPADRMICAENTVFVYKGDDLVAVVDIGVLLHCHISEAGGAL